MADLAKAKNFSFANMVTNWHGYISSTDPTNTVENVLVRGSQNVYKKLSGTLAVRQGQKRRGVANTTLSAISSSFIWNTSWGATYTLVVSNSKLYIVLNDVWYQLQTGLTKTRYVFDKWWDNTKQTDKCLFVNGTADLQMWNGGFGLISSTTANTIVLDRTIVASILDSASGSVVVNGTTYAYTGSSGSTLTGVTPTPAGEANGSAVMQAVTVTSNKPSAGFLTDFIKVINNQVYCGSYTSRLCYISSNSDYTNYTVPTPRTAGSPELLTLDSTLKGIGVRQGKAHIGIGSARWAVISFQEYTVGTTLTQKTNVDVRPVAVGQAPYAHEFIANVGDSLIYLAQDQQLRAFGDFNTLFVTGYPSYSQEIATELLEENFNGGSLTSVGEFTYISAPASGKVYLYQVRTKVDPNGSIVSERLWHSPFVWNLTKVDDLNGTIIGFSNANPQIYNLWGTNQWFDDCPTDEQLPYECVAALSYRFGGRRANLQSFEKLFTEGYISTGTPLNVSINYNYLGSTNTLTAPINSQNQPVYTFAKIPDTLGDAPLGDAILGDGILLIAESNLLPKFKCINSVNIINCFEYQPIYSSNATNSQWEILAVGTNASFETEENANFIINKLRT